MNLNKGDVFLLGKHRLMYGNSLSLIDITKLLDGQKADMMFTDPPYNVNYSPESRRRTFDKPNKRNLGKIMGDSDAGDEAFNALAFLKLIDTGIVKGAVYLCCGTNQIADYYPWLYKKFGYRPTFIMWVKNGFSMLSRDYHSQYEPILYFYYPEKKFRGDNGQTDIWFIKRRPTGKYVHPTMKPVGLIETIWLRYKSPMGIVVDLYLGSGSTLIAAEKTGRICYGMELEPKYVDVIIKRYEDY